MRNPFRKPAPLYPIHLYSLGFADTKREPMTWFRCPTCGYRTLRDSCEENTETCSGRWAGPHDEVRLVVASPGEAYAGTVEACDGRSDLVSRALTPG